MNHEIKLGLVGTGNWGSNYINTIKNAKGVSIKKIACKSLIGKENLKQNYEVTSSWNEIVLSPDIDGIIIASPPHTHFEIASEAIKNGKPVIIEKPLTLNLKDAQLLLKLQKENQSIVKVNHVYLYHPLYRFLKKEIQNNINLRSIYSVGGNNGPFRKDVSSLWDWGPHDLSMCLDIIDEFPLEIKAEYIDKDFRYGVESSNLRIILNFKNDKYAEIKIGNLMREKKRILEINFEDCTYIFDPIMNKNIKKKKNLKLENIAIKKPYNPIEMTKSPLEILINEFLDDISSEKIKTKDLNLAIKVINILEEIEKKLRN